MLINTVLNGVLFNSKWAYYYSPSYDINPSVMFLIEYYPCLQ